MGKFHQVLAAVAASFGSLVMGMLNVWPSYTVDLYTSPNTTVLFAPMSEFEVSMVGSLPALGAMVGTGFVGLLIDLTGRQKGGVLIALPFVLSWAILSATKSSNLILAGRFLGGIAGGAFLVYGPMFISETAEDSIRGTLASGPVMFYCVGTLISYIFGWLLTYNTIIWMNLAFSVVSALLCFMVVESPIFLLRQNREEDAQQAIARYRGAAPGSKVVLEELLKLKVKVKPSVEMVSLNDNSKEKAADNEKHSLEPEKEKLNSENEAPGLKLERKMSPIKMLFVSPSSRRAFFIVATTISSQIFMGTMAVQVNAKEIFSKAAPSLPPHLCSVLLSLVLVAGCMVPTVIADKVGRRVLLIGSSTLVGLCQGTLGFLLQTSIAPPIMSAVMILVFCFCFCLGAGTIPYVLLAEVFIPEVQSIASMICIESVWLLNFVLIAIFPTVAKLLGIHGAFYIFSTVGFSTAVISFFMLPETKGLSNDQIQEAFLRR